MKQFLLAILIAIVAVSILFMSSICESTGDDELTKPKHAIMKPRVSVRGALRSAMLNSEPTMKKDNIIVVDNKVEEEDDDNEEDGNNEDGNDDNEDGEDGNEDGDEDGDDDGDNDDEEFDTVVHGRKSPPGWT